MMKTKRQHTPRPWQTNGESYDCRIAVVDSDDGDLIAQVCYMDGFLPGESGEENARLIAAAPEMSAALYFLGGGSTYLEMHGRLCFCARRGKGDDSVHATTCVDAFKAWQKAGSPIEDQ